MLIVNEKQLENKNFDFFEEKAKNIRLDILEMVTNAKSSHIGSAYSIVDILTVLFHTFINLDLIKKNNKNRDYFILSKGHSIAALYATLVSVDLINKDELKNYYQNNSLLAGHPIKNSFPGIEASTGSLGHGLSIAVGLSIAFKRDNINNKIYVLLGDGECQEGSVWEAVNMAVSLKLNNLVIIIDKNNLQGFDFTQNLSAGCLQNKFQAFGCKTLSIDGHNYAQIIDAIKFSFNSDLPSVIVANTIKGKGVEFMQNKLEWHYKSPNIQEYELAKKEIQIL
ncbi:transketolase [Candidatus Babeliales bacterium]|nr:transketolase [Candidatus Babeliales bacterium]